MMRRKGAPKQHQLCKWRFFKVLILLSLLSLFLGTLYLSFVMLPSTPDKVTLLKRRDKLLANSKQQQKEEREIVGRPVIDGTTTDVEKIGDTATVQDLSLSRQPVENITENSGSDTIDNSSNGAHALSRSNNENDAATETDDEGEERDKQKTLSQGNEKEEAFATTTTTKNNNNKSLRTKKRPDDGVHGSVVVATESETLTRDDPVITAPNNNNSITLHDLKQLPIRPRPTRVTRGTPLVPVYNPMFVEGARRGTIACDDLVHVDFMAYWNDPVGDFDTYFKSPFSSSGEEEEKYVTFEPGGAGWNTIRMSMEIVFVFAAATNRTLVVPPELLPTANDGEKKERSGIHDDFFPFDGDTISKMVRIITMKEFLTKRPSPAATIIVEEEEKRERILAAANHCVSNNDKNESSCDAVYEHLRSVAYVPTGADGNSMTASSHCLVFDEEALAYGPNGVPYDERKQIDKFCGDKREVRYYDKEMRDAPLVHFKALEQDVHSLNHFYTFIHFTRGRIDNHFKRLVRDFLHYDDSIYCAAGKIVLALQEESKARGFEVDEEGGGGYSSLHVQRGDSPHHEISAEEWYDNTKELWKPKEILYIATEERRESFFEPMVRHYDLRFLDDYRDLAGLGDLDPNYLGMIDTIVASRGRIFVGTWSSTNTGYINRLRGYHGMSMTTSFYGTLDQKYAAQEWAYPNGNYGAREWPIGWAGIDGGDMIDGETVVDESAVNAVAARAENGPLGRGVSGLPLSETPALIGAKKGHIECDVDVDSLAYWNDPQGTRDIEFKSPFIGSDTKNGTKYISFEPDTAGWNNIRMSMEIVFVIAAATGRTLVLPPETPFNLLDANTGGRRTRGFGDFFQLHSPRFQSRVPTISTAEFLRLEGDKNGRFPIPEDIRDAVMKGAEQCEGGSEISCMPIQNYMRLSGFVPNINHDYCLIFDEDKFDGQDISVENERRVKEFCGNSPIQYFESAIQEHPLIHFRASEREYRLLSHFYLFVFFTDPAINNHYKRFVRDFLHYRDSIYCAAGKIVRMLQKEGKDRGFEVDAGGGGGYASMHIRRGDFSGQYAIVLISAEEWYTNLKDIWRDNEILYIATDERDKTFFDPIAKHHTVRFLNDYWNLAGLGNLDGNYMGMIDTIVASRGRVFGGTFYSTFSGYINRMRGYHGASMMNSFYGYLPRKYVIHEFEERTDGTWWSHEWPVGWIGIDGDTVPSQKLF